MISRALAVVFLTHEEDAAPFFADLAGEEGQVDKGVGQIRVMAGIAKPEREKNQCLFSLGIITGKQFMSAAAQSALRGNAVRSEILPGSFSVRQNPVTMRQTGIGKIIIEDDFGHGIDDSNFAAGLVH